MSAGSCCFDNIRPLKLCHSAMRAFIRVDTRSRGDANQYRAAVHTVCGVFNVKSELTALDCRWSVELPHPRPRYSFPCSTTAHLHSILMDFDTASQSLSPGAAIHNPSLRLPATCEPPSEHNPPKRSVWIVCHPPILCDAATTMADDTMIGLRSDRSHGTIPCASDTCAR
jgi:hypothetical protein